MTQDEQKVRIKRKHQTLGFGVNDAPLWLVKWFTNRAKEQFNDRYWACLADLKTKAEAYELMVMTAHEKQVMAHEDMDVDENTVVTFTGPIRVGGTTMQDEGDE